jgi:hypothetical protein
MAKVIGIDAAADRLTEWCGGLGAVLRFRAG